MSAVINTACALAIAGVICIGTVLGGPDDTEAAYTVADDVLTAKQAAACRYVRGADAEVYTVGQNTVCRAAGSVAGVTK